MFQAATHQARLGEALDSLFERNAHFNSSGQSKERVLHHVGAVHRNRSRVGFALVVNAEGRSLRGGLQIRGKKITARKTGLDNLGATTGRDGIAFVVLRREDNRPIGRDSFSKRTFFQGDRLARFHVFDVRGANVGDDRAGGFDQVSQRGDFPRVVHPDLPDGGFIAGFRRENRKGNADMVVQVSRRFDDAIFRAENRCSEFLGARFAAAAGNP